MKAVKIVMGLNYGLHNVPMRIEPGRSPLALPPFNNNNNNNISIAVIFKLCSSLSTLLCEFFCLIYRDQNNASSKDGLPETSSKQQE